MNEKLTEILVKLGDEHRTNLDSDSQNYRLVTIGDVAKRFGHSDLESKYNSTKVVVPLRNIDGGENFHVDGSGFKNYRQLKNGLVIHKDVAKDVNLESTPYVAHRVMYINQTIDSD